MNGRDVLLDLGSVTGQVSPRSDNMGEISLSQNLIGKLVKCTMQAAKNRQYKAQWAGLRKPNSDFETLKTIELHNGEYRLCPISQAQTYSFY